MIQFNNLSKEPPYLVFKKKYEDSLNANQKNIEAISIASYSTSKKEVNARYVNLKIVEENKFIFFSNYKYWNFFDYQPQNSFYLKVN